MMMLTNKVQFLATEWPADWRVWTFCFVSHSLAAGCIHMPILMPLLCPEIKT